MMKNQNKIIVLSFLLCYFYFPVEAQLSFHVDSLSCLCYGSFGYDSSWENRELYQRGPDILVYGTLTNNSDSPIILELTEYRRDTLITHKDLRFLFSYHYIKDYCFTQDPLIVSDILSYPYWKGLGLPICSVKIDEIDLSYSVIKAGESIPLAFESLSRPGEETEPTGIDPQNSCPYRKRLRHQKRVSKAIKTSLKITPVLNDYIDSHELNGQLLNYLSSKTSEVSQYDYESSIPQSLLEVKPFFIKGGLAGFSEWLREKLGDFQTELSGQESKIMIIFIIDKKGEIIYTETSNQMPNDNNKGIDKLLKDIILQSPKWTPGELHGERVDSRIMLMLTIDNNGDVKDLSIF